MKLYLTSYRIPDTKSLLELVGKPPQHAPVAIIANAKDYLVTRARAIKVREIQEYLASLGFIDAQEIDLRDYKDTRGLHRALESYDVIWAAGGNTFCLMEQVKASGLDNIIRALLEKDIVYVGESAGAVAAGKSLRGVEQDDEPEFASKQHWDGLGLIDKFILPHADNKFYAASNEQSKQIYSHEDLVSLNDDQALIINGSEKKIISRKP